MSAIGLTYIFEKLLQTMKVSEKSFTIIKHEYLSKKDPEFLAKYKIQESDKIKIYIHLKAKA